MGMQRLGGGRVGVALIELESGVKWEKEGEAEVAQSKTGK